MKTEQVREIADRLISTLERWEREQNRGPLARLRRGLSETTRHEAWPVLGSLFGEMAVGHPVFEAVAGCFAVHPLEVQPSIGNFGETLRRAMPADKMQDEKEPHTRFRRLLACGNREEICRHIRHAIKLAASQKDSTTGTKGVPVNYRNLFEDLWWWNDRVKVDWAKSYWNVPAESAIFSLAGAGTPLPEEEALTPE